jgi:hypothetical protein
MTPTKEQIHEIETALTHERPSQRYERLLACMAQARVDECGCAFEDALNCVLSSSGGLQLYIKMLRARVRER